MTGESPLPRPAWEAHPTAIVHELVDELSALAARLPAGPRPRTAVRQRLSQHCARPGPDQLGEVGRREQEEPDVRSGPPLRDLLGDALVAPRRQPQRLQATVHADNGPVVPSILEPNAHPLLGLVLQRGEVVDLSGDPYVLQSLSLERRQHPVEQLHVGRHEDMAVEVRVPLRARRVLNDLGAEPSGVECPGTEAAVRTPGAEVAEAPFDSDLLALDYLLTDIFVCQSHERREPEVRTECEVVELLLAWSL